MDSCFWLRVFLCSAWADYVLGMIEDDSVSGLGDAQVLLLWRLSDRDIIVLIG